ncbi:O-fucosylpeptide 3-beta-N-acetylglucosaminyltransferase [Bertholletia excelsa]
MSKSCDPNPIRPESPTNISHVVFGLIGSVEGWRHRRPFIESWWRPNITRGYLFLDAAPPDDLLPWPSSSPRFRVSEDTSVQILQYTGHDATMVRIARGILETFREGDEGVRWIVMGDDDSIFFTENLVEVLGRYDHNEYVYIGGHSESLSSNFVHSFDMGFGGAGVIFSYALAKALVPWLDECIKRYPSVIAADQMWQSCLADMGVYLTPHKGIHQIDLHGDISGLLSAHPQTPLLSLHHPEKVNAIFPSMDRHQSVNHLMKAASVDQSRLLQQTICYHRPSNWSLSISWGYSAHIYDQLYPKSVLQKPLQTFLPWRRNARPPLFRFNTRIPSKDPCDAPHVFYFRSVNNSTDTGQILTTYIRPRSRRLPPDCSFNGGHSPAHISEIRVFSPLIKLSPANQRECCDLLVSEDKNTAEVKYRACMKDEVIA